MATRTLVPEQQDSDLTLPCNTDLSTKQYLFVKLSSDLVVAAGAGEKAIGILQNAPVGTSTRRGDAAVRVDGTSKLKLGGTVTSGAFLKSDANGQGVVASTGDVYSAQVISAGVSGDLAAVKLVSGTAP